MCDGISCSDGDCGKRSEQQMKRILPVIAALALCPPVQAAASPYAVASRMCQMMSNGVSRQQAWKYVVDEYATGSMQGWSQTWGAPQFGGGLFGTLGGGIGHGIASGLRIGIELRGMRNEVASLVNNMCGGGSYAQQQPQSGGYTYDPETTTFVLTGQEVVASTAKPEPKNCWSAYLEKNPAMEQWAEANPGPAEKAKAKYDDC